MRPFGRVNVTSHWAPSSVPQPRSRRAAGAGTCPVSAAGELHRLVNALDSPERDRAATTTKKRHSGFQWSHARLARGAVRSVWYESVFMFVIGSIPDTHATRPCPLRSISARSRQSWPDRWITVPGVGLGVHRPGYRVFRPGA